MTLTPILKTSLDAESKKLPLMPVYPVQTETEPSLQADVSIVI